jgi:hypothetical protein
VAALAADPHKHKRTGQLVSSWEVARAYRLTDYDGRRPDWGRHAIDFSVLPESLQREFKIGTELQLDWLETMATRTRRFLAKIPRGLK